MKHQITFVGGQLLPVLVGIKEFSPDIIHFIVSEESKNKINLIKSFILEQSYSENICNPFDFESIKTICENLLRKIDKKDELYFNLTGGTKIMILAAQSLIIEKNLNGFYINQDDTFLKIPSYSTQNLKSRISIVDFLEISGHKLTSFKKILDFSTNDFKVVDAIDSFSFLHEKIYLKINQIVRKTFITLNKIPKSGQLEINDKTNIFWTTDIIKVIENQKEIFKIQSSNVRNLFFYASWWELLVAREIFKWSKVKELLIQCELPFKTNPKLPKNEIDVLVNLGGKLVFIECKSGMVKPDDINKMRIIKDTYGGIISKSLLVCRVKPDETILEKCKELNINLFYCNSEGKIENPLSDLIFELDKLEKQLAI
jgi:hypothetical protein